MAYYYIGSKRGYDAANALAPGETFRATDGSVWTKNQQGGIDVVHNGVSSVGVITYKPKLDTNTVNTGSINTEAEQQYERQSNALLQQMQEQTQRAPVDTSAYDSRINSLLEQLSAQQQQKTPTATDQSQALRDMYASNMASQQAQLDSDYAAQQEALAKESNALGQTYYDKARQTQGASEKAAQNWQETAAAYGLNSGTQGQAALARSNQLQSDLNTLATAEAQSRAEIERQRTLLGQQYQKAIEQAKADNDLNLAKALYQEAVRLDDSVTQAAQTDSQRALTILDAMLGQMNTDKQSAISQGQYQSSQSLNTIGAMLDQLNANRSSAMTNAQNAAEIAAAGGDYSGYKNLYGLSDSAVKNLQTLYAQKLAGTTASGGSSGGSRSGSGSGGGSTASTAKAASVPALGTTSWYQYVRNAAKSAGQSVADYIRVNYKALGVPYNSVSAKIADYTAWSEKNAPSPSAASKNLINVPGYGEISYEDADRLMKAGKIILTGYRGGKPVFARATTAYNSASGVSR